MSISELITSLNSLKGIYPEIIERIGNFNRVMEVLNELDELVEMKSAKDIICEQVKYLVVNSNIEHDGMLNAVITGSPGVGKTILATKLAKIWYAMGLIKTVESDSTPATDRLPILVGNYLFENQIRSLEAHIRSLQNALIKQKAKLSITNGFCDQLEDHLTTLSKRNRFVSYKQELNFFETYNFITNELQEMTHLLDDGIKVIDTINIEDAKSATVAQEEQEPKITIATREDFVAPYMGQTAGQTKKFLDKCKGGVLFIDEAYLLYNVSAYDQDTYGMEALTIINEYMSTHPGEIIIIFAGYKDLLDRTIFKAQPGLKRRCMWNFDIQDYTPDGLAQIFTFQLKQSSWRLDPSLELNSTHSDYTILNFFNEKFQFFTEFGGDTDKLLYHCKLAYSRVKFDSLLAGTDPQFNNIITLPMLNMGFKNFVKHRRSDDNQRFEQYIRDTMYS